MSHLTTLGALSRLSARSHGVFRGRSAAELGVSRQQLAVLCAAGAIERLLPDTYRMTAVAPSNAQSLRAALLRAGTGALAAGRSAGETFGLEGVRAVLPEIIVPRTTRLRSPHVVVHQSDARAANMPRRYHDVPVTGVEATLVALAHVLDAEAFEIACEDGRRRRLTSVASLRAYLDRYGAARRHTFGVSWTNSIRYGARLSK